MARKKIVQNSNGNGTLKVLYTGDTKNFNKFTVITEGHVGSVYFPIDKDIESTQFTLELIMPSNKAWATEMDNLIAKTDNPKALGNLKKCRNEHK